MAENLTTDNVINISTFETTTPDAQDKIFFVKHDELTPETAVKASTVNDIVVPIIDRDIKPLIPNTATAENQLADKDFVNSTVGTNTAIFRGTFNSVEELNAYSGDKTNNDYAFVIGADSAGNTLYNRYKYNGTAWVYEYPLNNSSFTAEQWAAINSGITDGLVEQIGTNLIDDTSHDTDKALSAAEVDNRCTYFGICDTAADQQNKTVAMAGFTLRAGSRITVKFTNGNTYGTATGTDSNVIAVASAPTLNVNGTGAATIYVGGEPAGEGFINAGDVHDFVYDGSTWCDVTADVIYKGGNSTTGYYEKKRNGLIEQFGYIQKTGNNEYVLFAIKLVTLLSLDTHTSSRDAFNESTYQITTSDLAVYTSASNRESVAGFYFNKCSAAWLYRWRVTGR